VVDVAIWFVSPLNPNAKVVLDERRMCSGSESDEDEADIRC